MAWKFLGTALGRRGVLGGAEYALAEYALIIGEPQQALSHANKALKLLEPHDHVDSEHKTYKSKRKRILSPKITHFPEFL